MKSKRLFCVGLTLLSLTSCTSEIPVTPATEPTEVTVFKVAPGPVELLDELPGRIVAFRVAEIRPQVSGIIEQRFFRQGSEVRAGQPLFQINAAAFSAEAEGAAATLRRAQATYIRANVQVDRLRPLVEADAVSRQSYDDAIIARDQAAAGVAEARAILSRRRLDIGFARVTAPISGIIGQALVNEGALVSAANATPLAIVQQIDQIYIDVRQPAARIEELREGVAERTVNQDAPVEIFSSTGRPYSVRARLLFSDMSVDAGTGDAIVRLLASNPDRQLLPGMFVRARLPRWTQSDAITVPQQSVQRDPKGRARVAIVNGKQQVTLREVEVGDVVDGRYVVLSGLRSGELVIIEGYDRIQPGQTVRPVRWRPATALASAD